jgi:hypothetical protein
MYKLPAKESNQNEIFHQYNLNLCTSGTSIVNRGLEIISACTFLKFSRDVCRKLLVKVVPEQCRVQPSQTISYKHVEQKWPARQVDYSQSKEMTDCS